MRRAVPNEGARDAARRLRRGPLVGLATSALLHGAFAASVVLVTPDVERLAPLFIDLTQEDRPPAGEGAPPSSPAPARPTTSRPPGGNRAIARGAPPPSPTPAPTTATQSDTPPPLAPVVTPAPAAPDVPAVPDAPPAADVPAALTGEQTVQAFEPAPNHSRAGEAGSETNATLSWVSAGDLTAGDPVPGAVLGGAGSGFADRPGQALAVAATGQGSGEPGAAYAAYLGRLRQRVHEALRYPAAARRRGLTGTVVLDLTVKPDGAIGPVAVVGSSSHALLDEAALATVRSLGPQPFPADLPPRTLHVRLPVVFELQ